MKEMELYEKAVSTRRIYEGKILNLRVDTVLLPDGKESVREVVEHGGAVCVVPLENDRIVHMVRQFRYAFGEPVLEIPAGKLDGDELVSAAASRELEEETGLRAAELIYLGKLRPSVAYLTEEIHIFLARGLSQSKQNLDEDEFLFVEQYPLNSLVDMIMEGKISDAKTMTAILMVNQFLNQNK